MKKNLLLTILTFFTCIFYSNSQRLLVLNEGALDFSTGQIIEPVSLGAYSLTTKSYTKLFEINGSRFASDLHLDGNTYWIAADDKILRYNIKTDQKISELKSVGVRRIMTHQDLLIVSRGEYLVQLNSYVQVYDKNTLELKYELLSSDFPYTTENIIVHENKAYIIGNNGFDFGNEIGKILVIDLNTLTLEKTIDLGPEAKNPENLIRYKDHLYTLNNRNFISGSTVSKINLNDGQVISTTLLPNVTSLCGTSVLVESSILYQESGKNETGQYNLENDAAGFYKTAGSSYYGLSYDARSELIVGGETDFFSFGKVYLMDRDLKVIDEFTSGISPGYFAFDYSVSNQNETSAGTTKILEYNISQNLLQINPQLNVNAVNCISTKGVNYSFNVHQSSVDISKLLPGIYTINVNYQGRMLSERFVKLGQ